MFLQYRPCGPSRLVLFRQIRQIRPIRLIGH
jgi:hypothetical protein